MQACSARKLIARATAYAVLLLYLLVVHSAPSIAADNTADELADKILSLELALLEITETVHLEAGNPGFARGRRVWLGDMGNGLATEGGLIAATSLFYSHTEGDNDKIRGGQIAATIIPQIAGQGIGASSALFELGADFNHSCKLHKQQLNGSSVRKRVRELVAEIDSNQSELEKIVSAKENLPGRQMEARFLRHLEQVAVKEFIRVEASGSSIGISRYIEDGMSLTRNSIGIVGNCINVAGVLRNNKRLNGRGSILNLISASLITSRPFLSNLGAVIGKKYNDRIANENFAGFENSDVGDLNKEVQQIKSMNALAVATAGSRFSIYEKLVTELNEQSDLASKEKKQSKQLAIRRYRESCYGPTKMAQSIIGIKIGFRHEKNATKDNRLAGAANLTYTTGQGLNLLELVRERVVDEQQHHKLSLAGMLPEQRIKRSLGTLESLQARSQPH